MGVLGQLSGSLVGVLGRLSGRLMVWQVNYVESWEPQ